MKTWLANTAIVVTAVLVAPASEAQSLVELAQKEKERRKAAGTSSRVITSNELGARSWTDAASEEPEQSPTSDGSAPEATKSDEELREEKQAELQERINDEVARMARVRVVMEESERQLNDLTDLTFGNRRADLLRLIEQGEDELRQTEENLDALEAEARAAGVRVSRPD